ncbi:MAG: GTPase HflX, partial [Thermoplasmata archaeon]|nr:GTPase HflX [Thermoplasmata archaeon]
MKGIILSAKEEIKEIRQLAESLGYNIIGKFVQKRNKTTPYYLGKGKIEEIKKFVEENVVDAVIVNGSLRPSQWYNLEKLLGVPVYDRIRIILEIFADRAKKKEAKLQVKLAKLRYEKPFVRELFHKVK